MEYKCSYTFPDGREIDVIEEGDNIKTVFKCKDYPMSDIVRVMVSAPFETPPEEIEDLQSALEKEIHKKCGMISYTHGYGWDESEKMESTVLEMIKKEIKKYVPCTMP